MMEDRRSVEDLLDEAYRLGMAGALDAAEEALERARRFELVRSGSSRSVHVMLTEGVIATYRGDAEAARGRFQRVIALQPLVHDADMQAHAWGWLALHEYNAGRLLAAAEAAARACEQPVQARPRTRLRAATDLAVLCEFAGLDGPARDWLQAAKVAAAQCQVPGLSGLIVYDLAAVRVNKAMVEHLRAPIGAPQAQALLLQVGSAAHFDAATGHRAQSALHDLVGAIALRLAGRAAEAVQRLERFLAGAQHVGAAERVSARIECIACRTAADPGHADAADLAFLEAEADRLAEPGERAHAYSLAATLAERAGAQDPGPWRAKARDALAQHDRDRMQLAERLAALGLATVPPAWAAVNRPMEQHERR
jgi:tetratricopeptide (TPR) repeat protein